MKFLLFLVIVCSFSMSGCISYKELISFQEIPQSKDSLQSNNPLDTFDLAIPTVKIQPNDVLDIRVFSIDPEMAAPFNVAPAGGNSSNFLDPQSIQIAGYLVSQEGLIDFPVLGQIPVKGLTTNGIAAVIVDKLKSYLKNPIVKIRLLNFTVAVTGEVNRQGTFTVLTERISLPEALALAGGLTDYAGRKNILVVREENKIRILKRVDLSSVDFFKSDYYYLQQNDLIYVEPIKAKRGAITDQTNKTLPIISAAGTLIAIIIALIK